VLGGALGLVAGVMLYGNGALPTSLLLVSIVAPTATLLGLAFALLGQRARSGAVRRSLDVISILPIITPPFVLAFAMIFLLGRRGLITYNLLDMSSGWIFGLPGVALAQILASRRSPTCCCAGRSARSTRRSRRPPRRWARTPGSRCGRSPGRWCAPGSPPPSCSA
jgi:hypothetical protein